MNNPLHRSRPSRLPPRDQLVMGLHALTELLRHAPQRILRVYTCTRQTTDRKGGLLGECSKWEIPVVHTTEAELNRMCGSDSHQSFAAHVKGRTYYDVKKLMAEVRDRSHSLILMCDQIFDPQNLGALIRSAECLGADAVGWSKNRGSDLTPAVSKASCGASEWMRLLRVSNLADAADQLQKEGYEIVAAVLAPGSQNVFRHRFAPKTVFIVGSEGEGIQPLLQKKADRLVHIPMEGKIESLNVAQAAVVLMTCYRICFL